MKIDLHIHTLASQTKNESNTRNIEPFKFANILYDAGVGVAAITNHDIFDYNNYKECESEIESYSIKNDCDKILLLPGVEIDVIYPSGETNYKNLNIIISDKEDLSSFEKKSRLYYDLKDKDKTLEKALEIFDFKKIILYLDHKNKRKFEMEDITGLQKELHLLRKDERKIILLLDVSSSINLLKLRARNLNTLIGTDIIDWKDYKSKSKQLLDINTDVKIFDTFIDTFGYNNVETYRRLFGDIKYKEFKNLEIKIENSSEIIGDLKIYDGVNIIFGPKATGKTSILKAIKSQLKNCFLYDSSLKNQIKEGAYDERMNELNDLNPDDKAFLISKLNQINEFKDFSFQDFKKLKNYKIGKKIYFLKYFIFRNIVEPEAIDFFCKKALDKICDILNIFTEKDISEYHDYHVNLVDFKNLLLKNFCLSNKDYWLNKMKKEISSSINEKWIPKHIGTEGKIMSIGLFERWNQRKKLLLCIESIKRKEFTCKLIIKHDIDIAERGKINLIFEKRTLNFSDLKKDIKNSANLDNWMKGKKSKLQKLDKIFMLNNCDFNEKIIDEEVKKILLFLIDNPFRTKRIIKDENNNEIVLSNGEEAILALTIMFDKDYDYYLLDEPDSYLNTNVILDFLIKKMWEKSNSNKRIILATHNPVLALNSIPFNMIYRDTKITDENEIAKVFFTLQGNPWTMKFINIRDEKDERDFVDIVVKQFESHIDHFNFRGNIYDSREELWKK